MTQEFSDEKLTSLLDGDLTPDERKLVEIHLQGDDKSAAKLRRLVLVRDLARELPRHNCPVNMADRVRKIRQAEESRKVVSLEGALFRLALKVGAVAAVLALVLAASLNIDFKRSSSFKPIEIANKDTTTANPNMMKVSGGEKTFDIFDASFKPEIAVDLGGFTLSMRQKESLKDTVVFHMSPNAAEVPVLLQIESDLKLRREFTAGYGMPVYRFSNLSSEVAREFINRLLESDPNLELSQNISKKLEDESLESLDIYLVVEFTK